MKDFANKPCKVIWRLESLYGPRDLTLAVINVFPSQWWKEQRHIFSEFKYKVWKTTIFAFRLETEFAVMVFHTNLVTETITLWCIWRCNLMQFDCNKTTTYIHTLQLNLCFSEFDWKKQIRLQLTIFMLEKHPRITNRVIKERKIITQICNLALFDKFTSS